MRLNATHFRFSMNRNNSSQLQRFCVLKSQLTGNEQEYFAMVSPLAWLRKLQ